MKCKHGIYIPQGDHTALYCSLCFMPKEPAGKSYDRKDWSLHDDWNDTLKKLGFRRSKRRLFDSITGQPLRKDSLRNGERKFSETSRHGPRTEPRFDRWQFDRANNTKTLAIDLWGDPEGFHYCELPSHKKYMPDWAYNDKFVQSLVRKYSQSRKNQAIRAAIIYLYYRCGWERKEIAKYLRLRVSSVAKYIFLLRKRAEKIWPLYLQQFTQKAVSL